MRRSFFSSHDKEFAAVHALERRGWCRACSAAPSLRSLRVPVEMVPMPYRGKNWFHLRIVPWAPKWAVGLVKRMKGLKVRRSDRAAAFKEALELGGAGPLAEAIIVAGKMMR
jgi:hypothetical protein